VISDFGIGISEFDKSDRHGNNYEDICTGFKSEIENPKSQINMIRSFINNPYQENTYILFDETRECAIIDPGMYTSVEQNAVVNFIRDNQLKPVLLLNTHCHIDHVLGNKFIFDQYGLKPQGVDVSLSPCVAAGSRSISATGRMASASMSTLQPSKISRPCAP